MDGVEITVFTHTLYCIDCMLISIGFDGCCVYVCLRDDDDERGYNKREKIPLSCAKWMKSQKTCCILMLNQQFIENAGEKKESDFPIQNPPKPMINKRAEIRWIEGKEKLTHTHTPRRASNQIHIHEHFEMVIGCALKAPLWLHLILVVRRASQFECKTKTKKIARRFILVENMIDDHWAAYKTA